MLREVDQGCGCGRLEAAVRHVHREARRARSVLGQLSDGKVDSDSGQLAVATAPEAAHDLSRTIFFSCNPPQRKLPGSGAMTSAVGNSTLKKNQELTS
jgi:hypothetical protein